MELHQLEEKKAEQEKCEKCGGGLFKLRMVAYGYGVEVECVECGHKEEWFG